MAEVPSGVVLLNEKVGAGEVANCATHIDRGSVVRGKARRGGPRTTATL